MTDLKAGARVRIKRVLMSGDEHAVGLTASMISRECYDIPMFNVRLDNGFYVICAEVEAVPDGE